MKILRERTTVTVQAKSLEEAKTKVKNSPDVARNKQQAARRQNLKVNHNQDLL